MNTPPGGSPHLNAWKPLRAASEDYALVPVVNGVDGWEPRYEKLILKRRLYLRRVDEIGRDDPDASALE
jgi:hypothetical protein